MVKNGKGKVRDATNERNKHNHDNTLYELHLFVVYYNTSKIFSIMLLNGAKFNTQ